jgi:ATP-dependent Clp protease ATP-binding subunit ClpB
MTSNVGSHFIQELSGKDRAEMERRVSETLRATFKPEFLNRIDETIIFHNLSEDQIGAIVDIQVGYLSDRLAQRNIELVLADSARAFLAKRGYDPAYGARPLRRAIQKYLENPLSLEILKGAINEGDRVSAEVEDDNLVFRSV